MENLRIARLDDMPPYLITLACLNHYGGSTELAQSLRNCATDADAVLLIERLKAYWLPFDTMITAVIGSTRAGIFALHPEWLRHTKRKRDFYIGAIMSGSVEMVKLLPRPILRWDERPETLMAIALSVSDDMAAHFLPPAEERTSIPEELLVECQRLTESLPRLAVFFPDEASLAQIKRAGKPKHRHLRNQ
jgi:hypothetical protein